MISEKRKVGPKGQVVIPKRFRDDLGIKPGEEVSFYMKDGELHVQKQQKNIKKKLENISKKAPKNIDIDSDTDYRLMKEQRWKKST